MLIPSVSHAVINGGGRSTSDNGLFWVQMYASTYRDGSYTFKNVQSNGKLYDVTVTTYGDSGVWGWNYYTEESLASGAQWVYDHGMSEFLRKNTDSPWSHNPGCGNTHTFTRTKAGDDAVCGSAHGGLYSSAPTAGLCSSGTEGTALVYAGYPDQYWWTCTGSGGFDKWCSARKIIPPVVNGVCGSTNNSCAPGTPFDINDSAQSYQWICLGSGGGNDSPTCTAPINNGCGNSCGNNNNSDTPVCRIDPVSITPVNGPSMTWSITGLGQNSSGYRYDWISTNSSVNSNMNDSYEITTSVAKILSDVKVSILKNSGNDVAQVVSCPDAVVADMPVLVVDEPIVQEDEKCVVSWDRLDPNASCEMKSQYGFTELIPDGGSTMLVSPTDPNNKYFMQCSFYDSEGVLIDTIDSNKVSCIKTGTLIEI